MDRVIAYIDGYNLYYGMKAAFGRKYLWLDLEAACASILLPNQTLVGVKYFTARVPKPADSQRRQSAYIDALAAATCVQSIFGRMQMNKSTCRRCAHSYEKPEEKKTDVAIASHLIADAYEQRYEVALLVSGDSDMVPPVEIVSAMPGRRVVAIFPPRRKSAELRRATGASSDLSEAALRQSQLPQAITLPSGYVLTRPATWQ